MFDIGKLVVVCVFVGVILRMARWAWKKDQARKMETKEEAPSEEEKKRQEREMKAFLLLAAATAAIFACILINAVFLAVLISLFVLLTLPIWNAIGKSNKFNKK